MKLKNTPFNANPFNHVSLSGQKHSLKLAFQWGLNSGSLATFVFCLFAAPSAVTGQTVSWDGTTTSPVPSWGAANATLNSVNGTQWTGDRVPGINPGNSAQDVVFLGLGNVASAAFTINYNNSLGINSLTFTNPTNSITFGNSSAGDRALRLTASSGTGLTTGVGAVTLGKLVGTGVIVVLTSSQTWDIGAGGLTVHNAIGGAGSALTKTGAGTLTMSGISGATAAASGGSDTGNTYLGGTTVNQGLLIVNTTMADAGFVTVNGGEYRVGDTDTVGAVTLSSGTISRTGAAVLTGSSYALTNAGTVSAVLGGAGALTKSGAGTATLSAANTYGGGTTISGGTLALASTGSIDNSPTIIVGASTTFDVSGVSGGYGLGSTQTLSGTGNVTGAMSVAGTLSPGASPGIMTTGNQTWLNGGDYNFQMLNATAAAGTGFDQIQITGTLNLSSLTAAGFGINLWSLASIGPDVSGDALSFNNALTQSWTILTTTGGITGFDVADFAVNVGAINGTAGFSNALGGGAFSLSATSNDLVLNFTAVPEPRAALLGSLGLLALLRRRR